MRTFDELGISPAPWCVDSICSSGKPCVMREEWDSSLGMTHLELIAETKNEADARLIAAAPMLYEALREAVAEYCHDCADTDIEHCRGKCFVAKWRDALAAASGESEVAK